MAQLALLSLFHVFSNLQCNFCVLVCGETIVVTAGVYGPHAVLAAITASHAFPHHFPSTKRFRVSNSYAFPLASYLLGSSNFLFLSVVTGSECAPATNLISWAAIFIHITVVAPAL